MESVTEKGLRSLRELELAEIKTKIEEIVEGSGGNNLVLVTLFQALGKAFGCNIDPANAALFSIQGLDSLANLIRLALIEPRVLGGTVTSRFPECVSLLKGGGLRKVVGSGILISPRLVLTAGHVDMKDPEEIWVGSEVGSGGGKPYTIERFCRHFGFRSLGQRGAMRNDLGFCVLEEPGVLGVVEPKWATSQEVSSAKEGWLVGFGANNVSGGSGTGTKREAVIPILRGVIRGANGRPVDYDDKTEIVAGTPLCSEDPKDACGKDSGAPFYVMVGVEYKVAGVTSRRAGRDSSACGSGAVYSRTDAFAAWIQTVLASGTKECPTK